VHPAGRSECARRPIAGPGRRIRRWGHSGRRLSRPGGVWRRGDRPATGSARQSRWVSDRSGTRTIRGDRHRSVPADPGGRGHLRGERASTSGQDPIGGVHIGRSSAVSGGVTVARRPVSCGRSRRRRRPGALRVR
jgi:hypothetical protein